MSKELVFINQPINFSKGIYVYPPSVKQVVAEKNFLIFQKMLSFSQEDIEDIFYEKNSNKEKCPTPLEFLFNNCFNSKEYEVLATEAFLFFTHEKVNFLYNEKMIIFGDFKDFLLSNGKLEDLVILNESNFFDFQSLIREVCAMPSVDKPNPNEHPKLKEMKRKARMRDKIKAKKGGISLFTSMNSICCMGLGINPLNIGEMSYVAMQSILNQYQEKEKYEIDIQSLLAGADAKKIKPEYWIRNL